MLLFVFVGFGLFAADLEEWTWDDYKTGFQVPSDFKVTKSDDKQFSASNAGIRLTIFPLTGTAPTWEKMVENLISWADKNKITYNVDKDLDLIEDLNGYMCVYIDGLKDKSQVFAGMLVNPLDTNVRLYVLITYTADGFDTALSILKSFTPQ